MARPLMFWEGALYLRSPSVETRPYTQKLLPGVLDQYFLVNVLLPVCLLLLVDLCRLLAQS